MIKLSDSILLYSTIINFLILLLALHLINDILKFFAIHTHIAFNKECARGKFSSLSFPGKLDQKNPFQSGSSKI